MVSTENGRGAAAICVALFLCVLCIFFAASIPKNAVFENRELQNSLNFADLDGINSSDLGGAERAERLSTSGGAYVRIGGYPVGISISSEGLIVSGKCPVMSDSGEVCPSEDADIKKGDILLEMNGKSVKSVYALKLALDACEGEATLKLKRIDEVFEAKVTPVYDVVVMQKRLGIMLKEDVGGVGTMTFITKNGAFAALGHAIVDGETGVCQELVSGRIFHADVKDVVKGERGAAGGLIAEVNRLSDPVGHIDSHCFIGIFGSYEGENGGELIRIAKKGEAKIGPAKVFTTVNGDTPKYYDIDVVKVISQSGEGEKGMVISVRDRELLDVAGGIVQGMSGSPIVQNGILIGAVTHVFIQDPTRGYAVHSRFMYDRAVTFERHDSVQYHEGGRYPLAA